MPTAATKKPKKPEAKSGPETIADLTPDPANCRKHNPRNIGSIVNSLHKVGAARSIVIDENDVILAGNGLVEAAGEAGIEKVRVVEADGNEIIAVRRTGLTPQQKAELAIADNRTSELSEWDPKQLLKTATELSLDLGSLDFTDEEIAKLGEDLAASMKETESQPTGSGSLNDKFLVVLTCRDEMHQRELLEKFNQEGIECRALIG